TCFSYQGAFLYCPHNLEQFKFVGAVSIFLFSLLCDRMRPSGGEMMGQSKYRIFELSARAVMSYAAQENGQWHFALDRAATEKCKRVSALHEQDGNALFFQIMCVVQGD